MTNNQNREWFQDDLEDDYEGEFSPERYENRLKDEEDPYQRWRVGVLGGAVFTLLSAINVFRLGTLHQRMVSGSIAAAFCIFGLVCAYQIYRLARRDRTNKPPDP